MREVNFNELIREETKDMSADNMVIFLEGALFARQAILDLILKVNDDNYNSDGEPINESCKLDAEALENISHLIKHGHFYEVTNETTRQS